jgi:hypothetical protein
VKESDVQERGGEQPVPLSVGHPDKTARVGGKPRPISTSRACKAEAAEQREQNMPMLIAIRILVTISELVWTLPPSLVRGARTSLEPSLTQFGH